MLAGCKKTGNNALNSDTSKVVIHSDTSVHHYLALGDSYTIGQSVPPNESYPLQLANVVNVAGFSMPTPTIIAVTGLSKVYTFYPMDAGRHWQLMSGHLLLILIFPLCLNN